MPRKATKKQEDQGAKSEAPKADGPMVAVLKTANAPKLSPRGDGELTYMVARMDDKILIRLAKNSSSGSHSKEWVPVDAIRNALKKVPKDSPFKGTLTMKSAFVGKSSTNGGFLCAALRHLGILSMDPEKKGMLKLTAPDALDVWEKETLALALPKDAEVLPLHPAKPKPFFSKKTDGEGAAEKAVTSENDSEKEKEPSEQEE